MSVRILSFLFIFLLTAGARADFLGHGGMVRDVAVSPDGQQVLSSSFDYSARLWNFQDQTEIKVFDDHNGPVNGVAFSPDGDFLLTASDDGEVHLRDIKTGKIRHRLTGHQHKVMGVAVSDDGKRVVTSCWDRKVRLWDVATGRLLKSFDHPSPVNVARLKGDMLITGSHDGIIRLWEVGTGQETDRLEGHGLGITGLRLTRDGKTLLSTGIDGTLRYWDLTSRQETAQFKKHDGPVFALDISGDGTKVVTTGRDGFLIHRDLKTGRILIAIRAHDRMAMSVALTPDGNFALTAGYDGSIRVWHLQTGDRIGEDVEIAGEPTPWLESDHPGARLYRKCARCHTLRADGPMRSGPHFEGLFGRKAGSVEGYRYSKALQGAPFDWNEKTLNDLFTQGPDKLLPGTKMPLQKVSNPKDLENLIAYMREITN